MAVQKKVGLLRAPINMRTSIIFHCNYLSANIGIPGVKQSVIADLLKYGDSSLAVYGSDYKNYYQFLWADDGITIETRQIEKIDLIAPTFAMFTGFDSVRRMIPKMIQSRRKGVHIGFWNWGYLCKQQSSGSWSSGKFPLWLKRCAIFVTRNMIAPLVDYYVVAGNSEREDSNLPSSQCLIMPMSRPQSAILTECDAIEPDTVQYSNESLTYIGRGSWKSKGVSSIVYYALSEKGKNQRFRFFISTKETGFDDNVRKHAASNMEWYDDVFGKDNLPWLQKSAAFITVNYNPIQLRAPYEALYAGTPTVMFREGYMDGIKSVLDSHNLVDAVQIIEPEEIESASFEVATLNAKDRVKLAEITQKVYSAKEFSEWFAAWLKNPTGSASYYEHIQTKLLAGK
jgi:hypothetical protein